jgi:two-component system cell cycle sensor histidine kinase/response regulator CckA
MQLRGSRQALELDLPRPGPLVRVDLAQLDQVLVNLVVNAREAMAEGGTIRIAVATHTLPAEEVAQGSVIPPGEWVVLSVSDEGRGIAPEILQRVFEPFFTTRRGQGGTGLGLSTVLGIMRQSGGHVSVAPGAGQGTVFRLWFPAAQGATTAAPPPAAPGPAAGTRRRVLLVDDEPAICLLARRALEGAGHEVRVAEDAEAALDAIAGGFVPDVVVSDVTMPGDMDGIGLVRALRAERPALPVILVSGYSEGTVGEGLSGLGIRFLEKPFRMAELVTAVGQAAPAEE